MYYERYDVIEETTVPMYYFTYIFMLKNVISLNTIENNTDEVRSHNSPSTEPKLKQKWSGPLLYHIEPNIKFGAPVANRTG